VPAPVTNSPLEQSSSPEDPDTDPKNPRTVEPAAAPIVAPRLLPPPFMTTVRRPTRKGNAGFSVLETLVAATVSGALFAAALPNLASAWSASQLQSTTRATAQYVRLARAVAIGKNLPSRISLSGGGTQLTTEVLRSGTWTSTNQPLVLEGGSLVSSVSPTPSALAFSTQGITSGAVRITIQSARGDTTTLNVSILGEVTAG
jgi:Tfp pilus assembly protein FimT